jgi:hypothetical protein
MKARAIVFVASASSVLALALPSATAQVTASDIF